MAPGEAASTTTSDPVTACRRPEAGSVTAPMAAAWARCLWLGSHPRHLPSRHGESHPHRRADQAGADHRRRSHLEGVLEDGSRHNHGVDHNRTPVRRGLR